MTRSPSGLCASGSTTKSRRAGDDTGTALAYRFGRAFPRAQQGDQTASRRPAGRSQEVHVAIRQPERSEPDPAADACLPGAPGVVWFTACAWCARILLRDRWIDGVRAFEDGDGAVMLTHGICPSCFDATVAKAEDERRRLTGP